VSEPLNEVSPEQTKKAYHAYLAQSDDWRSQFASLFKQIAMQCDYAASHDETFTLPADPKLVLIFNDIAEMFTDGIRGASHPLSLPVPKRGRKPLNSTDRRRQMQIAIVAGLGLQKAARSGESAEFGYRLAARAMSKAGCRTNWVTMRSAFQNRRRNGFAEIVDLIVSHELTNQEADWLKNYAELAAHIQKAPVF
jgi:hypothetical protein